MTLWTGNDGWNVLDVYGTPMSLVTMVTDADDDRCDVIM